jgi:hypothetical protein
VAATTAKTATTTTSPSTSLPSFYVTRVTQTTSRSADLEPGTAGVTVPAMARHVPETFEGLMMEAHSDL